MNPLIQEMANTILKHETEFFSGSRDDYGYLFTPDELEQFVQLIIRDCVGICNDVQHQFGEFTFTARVCKERIQQHFGVE